MILDELEYNSWYKCYTAKSCRATGLPMVDFGYANYIQKANVWLSKSRCLKIKKPVKDGEEPVAFLRVYNGYVPLYYRNEEELC
ncbi:MAG: hypothetical protein SPD90_04305 [Intestinibacter sp.]|uniref:hypothetical protein n=1 Tax=Intestinibacter sp. TaxID=1965304 RepID=UPI002A7F844F|nr:hypothetical protein [Intestinibacter sp.]MDY4574260.1 hypothetical protein [Intestinibacter sp.]